MPVKLFCLLMFVSGANLLFSQPVQTENAEVELISENLTIKPGEQFGIGVRMNLRDGWYVYYRNPGDSGMPLLTGWIHDNDFQTGEIQWPYPLWIDVGAGLASYGYYDNVLFMMEATAPSDLEPGSDYTLKAEAYYLICEKVCIPDNVDIELTLGVTGGAVEHNEDWLPKFADTRSRLPVVLSYWNSTAHVSSDGNEITLELTTDAFQLPRYSKVIYFANEEGEIENAAKPEFHQEGQMVVWLSVISSAPGAQGYLEPAGAQKITAQKNASPTAVLLDGDGTMGRAYDARVTPHMFIISPDGILEYNGAIDDRPTPRVSDLEGARNYVVEAMDALINGGDIEVRTKTPYGCSVKYK